MVKKLVVTVKKLVAVVKFLTGRDRKTSSGGGRKVNHGV